MSTVFPATVFSGKDKTLGGIPIKHVKFAYIQDGCLYVTDGHRAHCRVPLPTYLADQPDGWGVHRSGDHLMYTNASHLAHSLKAVFSWKTKPLNAGAAAVVLPSDWKKRVREDEGLSAKTDIIPVLFRSAVGWDLRATAYTRMNGVFTGTAVPSVLDKQNVCIEYWNDAVAVVGAGAPVRAPKDINKPLVLGTGPDAPHALVMRRRK